MLDIRKLRNEPDAVRSALAKRGEDPASVDRILAIDVDRRKAVTESEALKAKQNQIGPEIAKRRKAGEDASDLLEQSTAIKQDLHQREEGLRGLDAQQEAALAKLPNLPADDVQPGGEDAAQLLRDSNRPLPGFDFEPRPHWDLLGALGLADFERGTKLAGSGFVLYTGLGARLQRALAAFMLDHHVSENGYTELGLPYVLTRDSIAASGHIVKFMPEMYRDDESDLFFVPTAEPALVNIHRDEILDPGALPIRYVAHTPCWRREAGAAGKDTRGLQRIHQFEKVELFRYVAPEDSEAALEEMTAEACRILDLLEIPYRLLKLAAGDIAFASAKTYDIEAWAPGLQKWLEVSSASNCTDFQARRAGIRFRREAGAKPEFCHLLNASGLALPRVLAALLENHQLADGSVDIPVPLRPYLGGAARLSAAS